jgi:hypothetical protein
MNRGGWQVFPDRLLVIADQCMGMRLQVLGPPAIQIALILIVFQQLLFFSATFACNSVAAVTFLDKHYKMAAHYL